MPYYPEIHHRRSVRLKAYEYAQADLYFVTICKHNRECLFENIVGLDSKPALAEPSQITLNAQGNIISKMLQATHPMSHKEHRA